MQPERKGKHARTPTRHHVRKFVFMGNSEKVNLGSELLFVGSTTGDPNLAHGLRPTKFLSAICEQRRPNARTSPRPFSFHRRNERMSHVVTIQTKLHDPGAVVAACQRLNLAAPVQGTAKLYSGEATG